MLTLTGGNLLAQDGSYQIVGLTIDPQDGRSCILATNAADGSGNFSIPSTTSNDFTLQLFNPSLKCQGAVFFLSQVAAGVIPYATYDSTSGKLGVKLPFA